LARRSLLERLFEPGALRVVFQPVFESGLQGRTHYVESLIRGPEDTSLANPEILFEYARKKHAALAVDRLCIATVLRAARDFVEHAPIGINVHASSLAQDPELLNFIGDNAAVCGVDPSRLVLEIVEHAPPWDVRAFRTGIAGLREIGVRIALDDIGLGHSNFLMVLECRPDYFKIDRYFVSGSHADYYRRAVLRSVAELARPFGAQVVAEGVETDADLATVRELGIGLVQGYLLARPTGALEIRDRLMGPSALPWR
jgi:EAL domain-containing protein (putative c-di-GMP-specific phosphodiesterase class I)